jgi:hypothetical protein
VVAFENEQIAVTQGRECKKTGRLGRLRRADEKIEALKEDKN